MTVHPPARIRRQTRGEHPDEKVVIARNRVKVHLLIICEVYNFMREDTVLENSLKRKELKHGIISSGNDVSECSDNTGTI